MERKSETILREGERGGMGRERHEMKGMREREREGGRQEGGGERGRGLQLTA
jgi:hypothetical protein